MKTRASLLLLVAGLLLAASAPTASAAQPACKALHGKNLLRGGSLMLVDRGTKRKHAYVACIRFTTRAQARGRQLPIIGSRPGTRLEVLDSQGAFLVVRDTRTKEVTVWNVITRTRGSVVRHNKPPNGAVLIDSAGDLAARFGTALVGFDGADGSVYELDSGAIKDVRHVKGGDVITWKKGATTQRADLSRPSVECSDLAGKELLRTPSLVVTRVSFRTDFVDFLDGDAERLRACVLPDGAIQEVGEQVVGRGVGGGSDLAIVDDARTHLLLRERSTNGTGDVEPDSLTVLDVSSGDRLRVWGNADADGPNTELGDFTAGVVGAVGRVGAIFASGNDEQVVAFTTTGAPHVLDRAPAADIDETSLRIDGTVLHWTHAGADRSADLAAL